MSISVPAPEHPLLAAARVIDAALDDVAGLDPIYLTTGDKAALLVGLTRLTARVTALRADVLAVAEDLADQTADRSPGTWLAVETRTDRREAIADERLGTTLRDRWPALAQAARSGQVTWQQAGVLTHALDDLPQQVDPELLVKAEAHLLAEAGQFPPTQLRRLGRKVLEVIAPDLAEDHEHRLLLAEEHRAHT
ncbi:MAG TPA: DUF222 domain-containing protein, partial [Nocardioides sp.]|nr:DUF222 domain-containing protein [Nocardioides sp.]